MKKLKDMSKEELIQRIHQLNRGRGHLQSSLTSVRADFNLLYNRLKNIVNNIDIPIKGTRGQQNPKFHPGGNGSKKSS